MAAKEKIREYAPYNGNGFLKISRKIKNESEMRELEKS
jgi:hypothetical protein